MRQYIIHGSTAGILSTFAGVVYQYVYQEAMYLDFSKVINTGSIAGASFFACMLMALGYWLLERLKKPKLKGWLNVVIAVITFLSILGPISMTLPLDVESPELFPGLAIPMHFFPAMIFFGLSPFFIKETHHEQSNN
jgi:hypothetical protein